MKTSAKKTILKNSAKSLLAGKYSACLMALLFFAMISFLLNRFSINLTKIVCLNLIGTFQVSENGMFVMILSYAIPFFMSVIAGVLQFGLCLFFLNVATGRHFYSSDVLYGFVHDFKKSLSISFAYTLLSFLCLLPSDVLLDAYQGSLLLNSTEIGALVLLQILTFLLYLPISLSLSQIYFLALDYPELSAKETLLLSMKIMKGKKKQLFLIQLSFLPLYLLGALSFGVGFLWIIPYQRMTLTLYYLDIMKPQDH